MRRATPHGLLPNCYRIIRDEHELARNRSFSSIAAMQNRRFPWSMETTYKLHRINALCGNERGLSQTVQT
jgi:hypothetical protein